MTLDDEDTNSTDEANSIYYDTDTDDHGDDFAKIITKIFGSENDNGDEDGSFYGKSVGGNVRNEAAKLDSATREDETDIMMMTINDENMLMMMMLIQGGFF